MQSWTMEVETGGPGHTVNVTVPALEANPQTGTDAAAQLPSDDDAATRRTVGLVIGGTGLATVVVGAVLGGLASSNWTEAQEEHCRTTTLCDVTGVSLVEEARTFAGASTGLFIGGGALAVGGAILFFVSLGDDEAPTAAWSVMPVLGPQLGGLTVAGCY